MSNFSYLPYSRWLEERSPKSVRQGREKTTTCCVPNVLKEDLFFISHKRSEDVSVEIPGCASNGDPRLIAEVHCLNIDGELMAKR